MSTRCYILNLPTEILDLVYKYIPDIRDMLNFAKAHGVLGKAFAFYAGDACKTIEIWDSTIPGFIDYWSPDESTVPWIPISTREVWSDILSLCGSYVTAIKIRRVNTTADVVKLASMYCPNLEEFHIPISSSFWKHFKPLLLPLQNLVRIVLWSSYEIGRFEYVNLVEILQQLPKLENLELYNFNRKDLEDVGKLVNLKALTIDGKPDDTSEIKSIEFGSIRIPKNHAEEQLWPKIESLFISYMDFNTLLPYLPTLKYLIIRKTRMSLADLLGQSALSYGKTLEKLHFCPEHPRIIDADDIGIISKLKALKKLELPLGNDDCMDGISQLENLEMLTVLPDSDSYITNRGVMMVINGCKKLRYLDISECIICDSRMIVKAVSVLSLRPKEDPLDPFLLTVNYEFGSIDKSQLGGVLDIKHTSCKDDLIDMEAEFKQMQIK